MFIVMIIIISIIIIFAFMAYRTFIQKILKEKSLQYQLELDHQKEIALQFTLVQENERKRIVRIRSSKRGCFTIHFGSRE